ncbi:MAG: hypothetical protein CMM50_06665 [Rhodospirillaceae bacterium]|nr:hypothetical protein [Rhodospirillaceae bacterium]
MDLFSFAANLPLVWGILGLLAAYLVLIGLLISVGVWARIRLWIKVAGIVLTALFFWSSYHTFADVVGWPTEAKLPDRFELIAATVEEPDKRSHSLGAIYLWVVRLPGEGPVSEFDLYDPMAFSTAFDPREMPRAYRVPYSRELHKRVHDAQLRLDDTVRQVGVLEPPVEADADSEDGEAGKAGAAPEARYAFYDRPEPVLEPQGLSSE